MSLRLIVGRAGCGKTRHCLEAVRAELRASLMEGPRLVLLVPEQAALQMERALLGGGEFTTLGRCEVLSFRRLARRILGDAEGPRLTVLTPLGRQMLLRRLIARSRPRLRAFEGVADRAGFIAGLSRSVAELIEHHVEPVRLRRAAAEAEAESDPSAHTLADMAELLEAYSAMLGNDKVDAEGVLDLARRHLASAEWLRGARVWLDGFAGFTPQQTRFLADMAMIVERLELALLIDPASEYVSDTDAPLDPLSLFARTERTWIELASVMKQAGVTIVKPLRLIPPAPPRFLIDSIVRLERELFHTEPGNASAAAGPCDEAVRLIEAADPRSEVEAVVREVWRLTHEGDSPLRYRDIAIVCRDLNPYHDLIASELTVAGIPYFIDRRRPTAHHPLVEWTRAAIRLHDAATFGPATVTLLKTGLMPLSDVQADLLDNHILARGIHTPDGWTEAAWRLPAMAELPYVFDTDGLLAARCAFVTAIGDALPGGDPPQSSTGVEWVRRLDAFMQRCGVQRRLAEWSEAARGRGDFDESQEHEQVWRDTIALLDELAESLGDEPLKATELAEVLDAGFAEFTLGLVPPTLDQVLVGSIDRSRHPPVRAAFVLGLTDRQFPAHAPEDAILGDAERERLEHCGAGIGPTRAERLVDERMLAYIAVTRASERLWLSFPAADNDGNAVSPSIFVEYVRAALPGLAVQSLRLKSPMGEALHAVTPARFAAALAEVMRQEDSPTSKSVAMYDAARQSPHTRDAMARIFSSLLPTVCYPLSENTAAELNGRRLTASVSRLETLANCPFQHFARYGLRLLPRMTNELSELDLGSLYHEVLEHFFAGLDDRGCALRDLSPAEIAATLDATRQQILPIYVERLGMAAAGARAAELQLPRELLPALQSQHRWPGGASPVGTEVKFGGGDAQLPALSLVTPKGRRLELHGQIDRIDLHASGPDRLCLVYDYKRSRYQRLALDRVFHGLALQLLAYLLVLREHGDKLVGETITPAGAFFLPLLGAYERVAHPADADPAEFDRLRAYRPRGVLDFDWIDTLDPSFNGGRHGTYSVMRTKEGALGDYEKSDGLRRTEFSALLDMVRCRLGELCDRWLDGDVAVLPRALDGRLPCGHCDFSSVCRFEPARDPVVNLDKLSRSEVVRRAGGSST